MFSVSPASARLPSPYRDELDVLSGLKARLGPALDWQAVIHLARPWVDGVRDHPAPFWANLSASAIALSKRLLPEPEVQAIATAGQARGAAATPAAASAWGR